MNKGKSLKVLMAQHELTQEELADKLNQKVEAGLIVVRSLYTQQQVSGWCRNSRINDFHLMAICDLFDITASEFIKIGEA